MNFSAKLLGSIFFVVLRRSKFYTYRNTLKYFRKAAIFSTIPIAKLTQH